MFNKDDNSKNLKDDLGVFRPAKGSAKVIIGHGVKIKGEITNADEIQIEGSADVTINTSNLIVGSQGDLKGNIESGNADIWGKIDGDIKVSNTLTIQELGAASGKIEYAKLQIKLGGDIYGELSKKEKVVSIEKNKIDEKKEIKPLQEALKKD